MIPRNTFLEIQIACFAIFKEFYCIYWNVQLCGAPVVYNHFFMLK